MLCRKPPMFGPPQIGLLDFSRRDAGRYVGLPVNPLRHPAGGVSDNTYLTLGARLKQHVGVSEIMDTRRSMTMLSEDAHMPQSPSCQSTATVRDIMTTPVYSISMDASIRDAKALFDKKHFHHAIVLQRKRVVGVLSDRDVLKVVSPFIGNKMMQRSQDLSTLKQRIHQVMTRTLVTIGPDATVAEAAHKMLTERVSCLPVVDEEMHSIGILTIRDFLPWAAGTPKA